jgi:hypothetical protein
MTFAYTATVPWPITGNQADWVNRIATVQQWLEQYVGVENQQWCWDNRISTEFCAGVQFARDRDKMLFLLHWN